MTVTTISRRHLLATAPVAAIAVAIPMQAAAQTSDLAGWHRVKANYAAASAAESDAIDRQTEAEEALSQFWHTAPEGSAIVTEEAQTYGNYTIAAHERTYKLDRHNLRNQPHTVKETDDFAEYCLRLYEWKNDPVHVAAQSAFDTADAATRAAMDAKIDAWGALVAFPPSDHASMAEKVAIALPYVDGSGEWGERLLVALQGDLSRVTGA